MEIQGSTREYTQQHMQLCQATHLLLVDGLACELPHEQTSCIVLVVPIVVDSLVQARSCLNALEVPSGLCEVCACPSGCTHPCSCQHHVIQEGAGGIHLMQSKADSLALSIVKGCMEILGTQKSVFAFSCGKIFMEALLTVICSRLGERYHVSNDVYKKRW